MCDARIESDDGLYGSRARRQNKSGSRPGGAREQHILDECLRRCEGYERSLNLEGYHVSVMSTREYPGYIEFAFGIGIDDVSLRREPDDSQGNRGCYDMTADISSDV